MSQDQTSSLLESLLLAQASLQVCGQNAVQLIQQPQFPKREHSREYLSPYATSNVESVSPLAASSPQPDLPSDMSNPAFAEKVNEIIARAKANGGREVVRGSLEWEAAREAVLADMQLPANPDAFSFTNSSGDLLHMDARTGGRRGRGPRRRGSPVALSSIKLETTAEGVLEMPQSDRGGGRGRRGRVGKPRSNRGARSARGGMKGGKRKRSGGEDEEGHGNGDTDSSETFTPLPTQSRSGRKIFQANSSTPIIKIDDNSVMDASPSSRPQTGLSESSKKKKSSYRRPPGANALCKNCGRGHSPSSNVIVFCDGCNTPWHQYCHDPPIKGAIVQIEEKEWFCADCMVSREEKHRIDGTAAGDGMSFTEVSEFLRCVMYNIDYYTRSANTSSRYHRNNLYLYSYTPAPFIPRFRSLRPKSPKTFPPWSHLINQLLSNRLPMPLKLHYSRQKSTMRKTTSYHIPNLATASLFDQTARL